MEKEIRSMDVNFRSDSEGRTIDGYAIVFDSLSHDLGGFVERVLPTALDGVLEKSDVVALLNHDSSRGILGRSRCGNGSLKLTVDEKGLRFVVEAPHTALGDECLEYLRRGDANQCSFAFTVGEDTWTKEADGTYLRTINKFDRIYDCSILTCTPAYEATSVSCRSFEEFKAKEEAREAEEEAMSEVIVPVEETPNEENRDEAPAEENREEPKEVEEIANNLADYYNSIRQENEKYLKKD